jgi:hypothetical protein
VEIRAQIERYLTSIQAYSIVLDKLFIIKNISSLNKCPAAFFMTIQHSLIFLFLFSVQQQQTSKIENPLSSPAAATSFSVPPAQVSAVFYSRLAALNTHLRNAASRMAGNTSESLVFEIEVDRHALLTEFEKETERISNIIRSGSDESNRIKQIYFSLGVAFGIPCLFIFLIALPSLTVNMIGPAKEAIGEFWAGMSQSQERAKMQDKKYKPQNEFKRKLSSIIRSV